MSGQKSDAGKSRWSLVPRRALGAIVDALTFGAKKYSPNGWMRVENPKGRYTDALIRHLVAWGDGERLDDESKLPHLAHAGCCLLFLLHFDLVETAETSASPSPSPSANSKSLEESNELVRLREIERVANDISIVARETAGSGGTLNSRAVLNLLPRHLFDPATYAAEKAAQS